MLTSNHRKNTQNTHQHTHAYTHTHTHNICTYAQHTIPAEEQGTTDIWIQQLSHKTRDNTDVSKTVDEHNTHTYMSVRRVEDVRCRINVKPTLLAHALRLTSAARMSSNLSPNFGCSCRCACMCIVCAACLWSPQNTHTHHVNRRTCARYVCAIHTVCASVCGVCVCVCVSVCMCVCVRGQNTRQHTHTGIYHAGIYPKQQQIVCVFYIPVVFCSCSVRS